MLKYGNITNTSTTNSKTMIPRNMAYLQKELFIFRIVQELLNNIVKHAAATIIHININYISGRLKIEIIDNGKGFDPTMINNLTIKPKGIGLYNMLNRITLVNGKIQFNSEPGKGTIVNIEISK